jgi:hypothetical protein
MQLSSRLLALVAVSCSIHTISTIAPALASTAPAADAMPADGAWTLLDAIPKDIEALPAWIRPTKGQALFLSLDAIRDALRAAPLEATGMPGVVVSLPTPEGGFRRFRVVESPIMHPDLAARYPQIKTYLGQGIDDRTETVRFELTQFGFGAQVLGGQGRWLIDSYSQLDTDFYTSHYASDEVKQFAHRCEGVVTDGAGDPGEFDDGGFSGRAIVTRREYQTVVAATGEYTAYHSARAGRASNVADGQAAVVVALNRVNQLYERDVAVRMILVANNDAVVYANGATDPYTNNSGGALLGENQTNVNSVIGSANYDIGHVFSTGGGGVAGLRVVCVANNKARGVTGSSAPINDSFWVDFVAHEMGHQFGGNHCFNASCGGNRSGATAYEPGSGSSVMAYAGVCSPDNVANTSDFGFHAISLSEITAYTRTGGGNGCATQVVTTNNTPTVSAGPNLTLPTATPFRLEVASSADADGDALTYSWEQYDLGPAAGLTTADDGQIPLLRYRAPAAPAFRNLPILSAILNGTNTATGERLPAVARTSEWRVVVRDNRAGGGGFVTSPIRTLTFVSTGASFAVTAPNTNVSWSGARTVTWNVAGTNAAPINCANVDILLSTDGGQTFPTVLAANTPNDGSEAITLPPLGTSQARIQVRAVGNIFFDIGNTNFTIVGPPAAPANVTVTPSSTCAGSTVTLTASSTTGVAVDWYANGCGVAGGGTFLGTGTTLGSIVVNANTTFFAQSRRTSDGQLSVACGSASVTVGAAPVAPTSATTDRSDFCSDDPGSITLSAVGGSGTNVRWFAGSCGSATIGTDPSITIDSPAATTTYFVRWETTCGNSACASVTVNVNSGATVTAPTSAASDPASVCPANTPTITLSASGGSGQILRWYTESCGGIPLGAGTSLVIPAPATATTYFARWESDCGNSACASVSVGISSRSDFNNDGFIDFFDFDDFTVAFENGDSAADFNNDGFIDFFDFDDFVVAFTDGC